jgi:mono/diheme cytochrome c family protein
MRKLTLIPLAAALVSATTPSMGASTGGPPKMPYVFEKNCFPCHKEHAQVGPMKIFDMRTKAGNPLNEEYVRSNVRFGFNAMPAFRPSEVNTRDMDGIVAYLKDLAAYRKAHPGYQPAPARKGGDRK